MSQKSLEQLEAENEQLREALARKVNEIVGVTDLQMAEENERLRAENERLRTDNAKLLAIVHGDRDG